MYPQQKLFPYRRNNGIYYIGVEVDGKRRWKSTGTKKKSDALRAMSDYRISFIHIWGISGQSVSRK